MSAGASWSRIYPLAYSPEYFDTSNRHRFNASAGEFGTLYAGSDDHCAFVETFGRELDLRVVAMRELALRGRSRVEIVRDVRLVDLTGPGLAQIRADGRLTTGDYAVAQRWSLAFHEHPDQPDGLIWRSRFDLSRICVAIYDRARPAIRTIPIGGLDDPRFAASLANILDEYGFALI
jgi:RES domain-containing protein